MLPTSAGVEPATLIVEEISNVDVKCASHCSTIYRSRSPGQGICRISTSRRSTMHGLVAVGLIVDEIPNVDVKCVKVTGARNIGQGHRIKVPAKSVH